MIDTSELMHNLREILGRIGNKKPDKCVVSTRQWGNWDAARRLVLKFFEGDEAKTDAWFATSNPMLGDISPNAMVIIGRDDRLLEFVRNALEENKR